MTVSSITIPELDELMSEPAVVWSYEDEELMRKYYSGLAERRKVSILAEKLNRPITQIYSKAQRMGLK